MNKSLILSGFILSLLLFQNCRQAVNPINQTERDPHSFSRPDQTRVKHIDLELNINFELKQIQGTALLHLETPHSDELVLDNMGLQIKSIYLINDHQTEVAKFELAPTDSILGTAIHIPLLQETKGVKIEYSSSQDARALQWLPKEQTLSQLYPFLFTQSQSIYARSWIPCPDGPGMRFTYHANVTVPPGMMAVMSATNPTQRSADGHYDFNMEIPVPAYLMALAVGDFDFQNIGTHTGVYAEPALLKQAAAEFSDLENMLITAENLYGAYPWSRYDVIVLPGSFPFGGMENPRMTFLTPSVIAGDQSLTSLLAHELAHSWSGNLVTNSTWNDFWLNEGITTYFESRIMEALYGKPYADMLSILGLQDLQKSLSEMGPDNPFTKLKLDLKGIDPEEAATDIAYEKGKALMRYLEERMGRTKLDSFLQNYFHHFKFKSNTSEGFLEFANASLLKGQAGILDTVTKWIYNPGWLAYQASYDDAKFVAIQNQMKLFSKTHDPSTLDTRLWSTHEWLYFIRLLPSDGTAELCKKLDETFKLSTGRNCEIQCAWFEYAITHQYGKQILPEIETFAIHYGRRKYLKPIYSALMENKLSEEAKQLFEKAKSNYHPISRVSIEKILRSNI